MNIYRLGTDYIIILFISREESQDSERLTYFLVRSFYYSFEDEKLPLLQFYTGRKVGDRET